jgi:hypothetical protein
LLLGEGRCLSGTREIAYNALRPAVVGGGVYGGAKMVPGTFFFGVGLEDAAVFVGVLVEGGADVLAIIGGGCRAIAGSEEGGGAKDFDAASVGEAGVGEVVGIAF